MYLYINIEGLFYHIKQIILNSLGVEHLTEVIHNVYKYELLPVPKSYSKKKVYVF